MSAFYVNSDLFDSEQYLALNSRLRSKATALWALAGSWMCGQTKNGFVPHGVIQHLRATVETAKELVRVELWSETDGGYTFLHEKKFWKLQPQGRPALPVVIRATVLEQHGMHCWLCDKPIATKAELHLDHVHPRSQGGSDLAENLRPAHARCNVRRGTASAEKFMAQLRAEGVQ